MILHSQAAAHTHSLTHSSGFKRWELGTPVIHIYMSLVGGNRIGGEHAHGPNPEAGIEPAPWCCKANHYTTSCIMCKKAPRVFCTQTPINPFSITPELKLKTSSTPGVFTI